MPRTLLKLSVASLLIVGLIGVLHMPFARGLLRRVGGCPLPTTDRVLTGREAEQLRVATFAPDPSLPRAQVRPALGFALEHTTRADALAWAKAHGITCRADRHGAGLTCDAVPANKLPVPGIASLRGALMLGFSPAHKLVSVHYLSRGERREDILARSQQASLTLSHLTLDQRGDPSLSKPLSQLKHEARYRDYLASVAVTHLGHGYSLSESYQSFAN